MIANTPAYHDLANSLPAKNKIPKNKNEECIKWLEENDFELNVDQEQDEERDKIKPPKKKLKKNKQI